jgi:Flp pilus assembly protein TadB
MSLVSDSERERAAASLRQQFVHGRLSTEQLAERVALALAARNRRDVKRAFRGLPPLWRDSDELRRIGLQAKRRAVRAVVAAAWIFVTFVLLVAFISDGMGLAPLIAYGVVWLMASTLAWLVRRRA